MTTAKGRQAQRLVVLRVVDSINPALAGRSVASYESPPQTHEQAMTLVRLLVGWPVVPLEQESSWRCPVAGGVRTVTLATVTKSEAGQRIARAVPRASAPTVH